MKHLSTKVDGSTISAFLYPATQAGGGNPLLIALHGGTFTSEYFCVAGSPSGSFVDIATRNGFPVLLVDRPGYGSSDLLPESENTFARQAELLDAAIGSLLGDIENEVDTGAAVVLGHSIGGMISLEIAARQPSWPLVGVTVAGMGARIPKGGAAEQLAALPLSGVVDLPVAEREPLWYGPAGSASDDAMMAARTSFAPAPMVELKAAPEWAAHRLDKVVASITVPVHHTLGQFDSLWDASPEARELFLSKFNPTQPVSSEIMSGVGHCIDHHLLGTSLHYRQLAFAHQCTCRQFESNVV